jgi:hypothetical protein
MQGEINMMTTQYYHSKTLTIAAVLLAILSQTGCQSMGQPMARSMGMIPMGSKQDIADADQLWAALKRANLVGSNAQKVTPYTGQPPHGAILETLTGNISLNGHSGLAIVKRNYGGPGVSIDSVDSNRAKYLKAVTVMYKREAGYDDETRNWFWAKYTPDGGLNTKSNMGMDIALAGRVAKGKPEGCISCHMGAPGGDYVFSGKINIR